MVSVVFILINWTYAWADSFIRNLWISPNCDCFFNYCFLVFKFFKFFLNYCLSWFCEFCHIVSEKIRFSCSLFKAWKVTYLSWLAFQEFMRGPPTGHVIRLAVDHGPVATRLTVFVENKHLWTSDKICINSSQHIFYSCFQVTNWSLKAFVRFRLIRHCFK